MCICKYNIYIFILYIYMESSGSCWITYPGFVDYNYINTNSKCWKLSQELLRCRGTSKTGVIYSRVICGRNASYDLQSGGSSGLLQNSPEIDRTYFPGCYRCRIPHNFQVYNFFLMYMSINYCHEWGNLRSSFLAMKFKMSIGLLCNLGCDFGTLW